MASMANDVAIVDSKLEPNVVGRPHSSNVDCFTDDEDLSDMMMDDALHAVPRGRTKKRSMSRDSTGSGSGMVAVVPEGDSFEESQKVVASSLEEAAPRRCCWDICKAVVHQVWACAPMMALLTSVGCLFCIVPLSLLANAAAEAQISAQSANAAETSIETWRSTKGEKASSVLAFTIFDLVVRRCFTYGSYIIFGWFWWGSNSIPQWIHRWLPAMLLAVFSVAFELTMFVLASSGSIVYAGKVRLASECGLNIVCIVAMVTCLALTARTTFSLSLVWRCTKLVLATAMGYVVSTQLVLLYWRSGTIHPRLLLVVCCLAIRFVRAIVNHVVIITTYQLPNFTNDMGMVMVTLANSVFVSGTLVLQLQTSDLLSMVGIHLIQAMSEAVTNFGYLMCETEVDRWRRAAKMVRRRLRNYLAAKKRASDSSHESGIWLGSLQHPPPELTVPAKKTWEEPPAAWEETPLERRALFTTMVVLTNTVEVSTLMMTCLWYLLCKVNTSSIDAGSSGRQTWQQTLVATAIALFFEIGGDVCTHLWYQKTCPGNSPSLVDVRSQIRIATLVAVVGPCSFCATTILLRMVTSFCPSPDEFGRLKAINLCG